MKLNKLTIFFLLLFTANSLFAATVFKLVLKNNTTHQAFFFAGFDAVRGPILKDGASINWSYSLDDAWAPFGFLSVDGTKYLCKKDSGDYLMLNPRNYKPTDIVTISISALQNNSLTCSCDPDKDCSTAFLK